MSDDKTMGPEEAARRFPHLRQKIDEALRGAEASNGALLDAAQANDPTTKVARLREAKEALERLKSLAATAKAGLSMTITNLENFEADIARFEREWRAAGIFDDAGDRR